MNETTAGPLAWVNGSDAPEKSAIDVGFMALSDCASVVVAATQGFAQPYGLTLNLKRQSSWANLRDKLVSGELDAVPIPAIEYARHAEDLVLVPDISISSDGEVQSILLMSKEPAENLTGKTVALTDTSRT